LTADKGLTAFNPASHLIWWVGGVILALLFVFLLLDLVQELRQRRSYAKWLREQGEETPSDRTRPGPFRLREYLRRLRVRYLRRIRSGFSSTRSRGLGQPPWKSPDEWSPLDTRPGKHESK